MKHLCREDLENKIIDIHSHVGISQRLYSRLEYPYGQSVEGLYYRQKAVGVDVNVIFPLSPDLYFDPAAYAEGEMVPAEHPLSPVPYGTENRMVMQEVFRYCAEHKDRFIPFVSVDPGRDVAGQMRHLEELEKEFPIYGIKIVAVSCQSPLINLLGPGAAVLDFARERNIPFLFHMSSNVKEQYGSPKDTFSIIEKNPDLRFCLAHGLNFDKHYLSRAGEMHNVWVDTSAIKIQVELYRREVPGIRPPEDRFETDFNDYKQAVADLVNAYPETIIWGSDAPAYTYFCRRKQGEGNYTLYSLKGTYEDEMAALKALPPEHQTAVSNSNSLNFLFGPVC